MTTVGELWRREVRGTPRRRVVGEALATFAVGLALLGAGLVSTSGPPLVPVPSRWVLVLPLAAVCLLMLAKRSHPVAALALGTVPFVVDLLMGGTIGVLLGYIDLIYCVALWADRVHARRLEVFFGVLAAGAAVTLFVVSGDLRAAALLGLVLFALLITPMWWGRAVRTQADLTHLADARADDLQRLAELRETEVLREERARMAHELHDALAGNLAAISIHAEAALSRPSTASATPGEDRPSLETIREASVAAADELRAMVHILRSGEDERTAPARLAEIEGVLEQARTRGVHVDAYRPGEWPVLPAATDHAAYRIVQEALTNAAKHAPGSPVRLVIEPSADALAIEIDNGLTDHEPAASPPGGGIGLVSMRERTTALGGTFTAGRQDGSWRVRASLPLDDQAHTDEGSTA